MDNAPHVIDLLGGPKKVAEMLGIVDEPGAIQRVGNWKRRGIPAQVLVDHPSFFRTVKKAERDFRQLVATNEPAHA